MTTVRRPGDAAPARPAAWSGDDLRIGDAERDLMSTALQEHFAEGRLTRDEFDERLSAAMSARTRGDLRALSRDLPEPRGLPEPPEPPPGAAYRIGRGPGGLPWSPPWSPPGVPPWQPPWARPGAARPPGPPLAPFLAMGFLVTVVLVGPKALIMLWPLLALLAFHRRRAWRRRLWAGQHDGRDRPVEASAWRRPPS